MTIGETLHKARLQSGLTLDQISTQTRIKLSLLVAIEEDEINKLPPGAIGRSFVRQYAQIVGVDRGDLQSELDDFSAAAASAIRHAPHSFRPSVAPMKENPRAYGSLFASLLWVFAVILFCSGAYWLLTRTHVLSSAPSSAPARQK